MAGSHFGSVKSAECRMVSGGKMPTEGKEQKADCRLQTVPSLRAIMHLSMLSCWGGGRPGIGGGFDSNHRPVVGTFDHFNSLSSNILLTFSCYFDNPQMPCGGAFEQKHSVWFKWPAYARRPPPPQRLNIDRCINRKQGNWNVKIMSYSYGQLTWVRFKVYLFHIMFITLT